MTTDDTITALREQGFKTTCSVDNPVSGGIVYARGRANLVKLSTVDIPVYAIVPVEWRALLLEDPNHNVAALPRNVTVQESENPLMDWVTIHNEVHAGAQEPDNRVSVFADIHPTAVIGADGARYIEDEHGLIPVKHVGNVVIEDDVHVGANTVVHRALLDSTVIREDTKIGSLCNVGHNVEIGQHCVLTAAVVIGGSCRIGDWCWFGTGSVVKNGVSITDRVKLGASTLVVRDITEPGVYVGNPARFLKEWNHDYASA